MAMERMKNCPNVTELAEELGMDRTVLYHWQGQMDPVGWGPAANSRERNFGKRSGN